ncbi:MAG: hypothetical protein P1U56_01850 [Saprospiraceae bacterium]|nr:hypothetical protein [Saprospiraceae bacterium]
MNKLIILFMLVAQISIGQNLQLDFDQFKTILKTSPCTFEVDLYLKHSNGVSNMHYSYAMDEDQIKVTSKDVLYIFNGEIGVLIYHPDQTVMVKQNNQNQKAIEVDFSQFDFDQLIPSNDVQHSIYDDFKYSSTKKYKVYTYQNSGSGSMKSGIVKIDKVSGLPVHIETVMNTDQRIGYPEEVSYRLKNYRKKESIPSSEFSFDDILTIDEDAFVRLTKKYSNYNLIGS